MSHLSEIELLLLDLSDLPRDTPFIIGNVMQTQFSISRYYGGCTFMGKHYSYVPTTDELIREDVVRWLTRERKRARAEAKKLGATDTPKQDTLI